MTTAEIHKGLILRNKCGDKFTILRIRNRAESDDLVIMRGKYSEFECPMRDLLSDVQRGKLVKLDKGEK